MAFIRAKEIPPGSGNWYDYEVETIHEGGRVIQKHIRYWFCKVMINRKAALVGGYILAVILGVYLAYLFLEIPEHPH